MTHRFSDRKLDLCAHAVEVAKSKGFSVDQIKAAWNDPEEVYASGSKYPGQWRICGHGVCLVGRPVNDTFMVITMYVNREVTPLRADQMNDPAALASARCDKSAVNAAKMRAMMKGSVK